MLQGSHELENSSTGAPSCLFSSAWMESLLKHAQYLAEQELPVHSQVQGNISMEKAVLRAQ